MKELLHAWIRLPFARECLETRERVGMQMTDLREIAFLFKNVRVKQAGVGVLDG
jgi:hypothetical protein